jgi:hypothetical protein
MSGTLRRPRRPRVAAVTAPGPTRRMLISPQKLGATGSLLNVQQVPTVTILSPSIRRHLRRVVIIRGHCGSRWGDCAHRPQPAAGGEASAHRGRRRQRKLDRAAAWQARLRPHVSSAGVKRDDARPASMPVMASAVQTASSTGRGPAYRFGIPVSRCVTIIGATRSPAWAATI